MIEYSVPRRDEESQRALASARFVGKSLMWSVSEAQQPRLPIDINLCLWLTAMHGRGRRFQFQDFQRAAPG